MDKTKKKEIKAAKIAAKKALKLAKKQTKKQVIKKIKEVENVEIVKADEGKTSIKITF